MMDRIGYVYVQHVAPSSRASREEAGASAEPKAIGLQKYPPRGNPEVQCLCRSDVAIAGEKVNGDLPGSCRGCPVGILGGLARVHIEGLQAVLTAYGTAPVEFTLALGHPGDAGGIVASATAHDFTAVHASGSQIAHAACCTQGAWKTSQ